MINKKQGQGHIEMVLSMVLFVSALIVIFIFMNPFSKISEGVSIIGDVEDEIMGNISQNIGRLSVVVDDVNGLGCESIKSEYGSKFKEVAGVDKSDFYFADFFTEGVCLHNKYRLGAFTNEEIILNSSIYELKTAYDEDYPLLKKSLGLLDDFSFNVKDNAGLDVEALTPLIKQPPVGVDVESKDIPVRALKNDGIFEELVLNIRAW